MAKAENGKDVEVHYTGTLENGEQFDSSKGRDPLKFTMGAGQMIPGFEEAVTGMEVGETKTVTIPAEKAYGERHEQMILTVPRNEVPPDLDPQIGMQLELRGNDGSTVPVIVSEINDETITLDGNHPLAGKDLTFEIEVVNVA